VSNKTEALRSDPVSTDRASMEAIKFRHHGGVNVFPGHAFPGRFALVLAKISSRELGRVGTTLTSISH
jgi:hypothetical protein